MDSTTIWVVIIGIIVYVFVKNFYIGYSGKYNFICPNPNCGYKGIPKRTARGSALVGLILLCFFILPGLIYFMFKGGYRYTCPKCGMQIRSDN